MMRLLIEQSMSAIFEGQDGSWENIQKYDFMVAEVTQAYGEDGTVALPAITLFAIFLVWCNLI